MNFLSQLNSNDVMYIVLTVILSVCTIYLIRLNNDKKNTIYLMDLVTTNGILNERKLTRFFTWMVSTWGFIYLLSDDKLTEWYFIGYMGAWVANALIGKTLASKDADEYEQRSEQYRNDIDQDQNNINK